MIPFGFGSYEIVSVRKYKNFRNNIMLNVYGELLFRNYKKVIVTFDERQVKIIESNDRASLEAICNLY